MVFANPENPMRQMRGRLALHRGMQSTASTGRYLVQQNRDATDLPLAEARSRAGEVYRPKNMQEARKCVLDVVKGRDPSGAMISQSFT